jgi:glycosyltransferase involved in cell wall biosynthesis
VTAGPPAGGRRRVSGVTLVIPVRDEADNVGDLIGSIQAQTRPPDEIIIVDGGSTDGTLGEVRALVGEDPRAQIVQAGMATPGRGRNVGRSVARNPWIAFTDAGTRLDPHWLERLVDAAEQDPSAEVVFGSYQPQISSFLESCAVGAYIPAQQATPAGWWRGPSVASLLVSGDAFDGVQGFPDARAAEDQIFLERLQRNHIPITWAAEAIVHWQTPRSLSATYRRFRQYSYQNVLLGRQGDWHHGVARLYLSGVIGLALGLAWDRRTLRLAPVGPLARAAHNLWAHRREFGLAFVLNPVRIVGVAGLTLLIDAATFTGWAGASFRLLRRWPSPWHRSAGRTDREQAAYDLRPM